MWFCQASSGPKITVGAPVSASPVGAERLAVDLGVLGGQTGLVGPGVLVRLPEQVGLPVAIDEDARVDRTAERLLADERRGGRQVRAGDRRADGVADAHRLGRHARQLRGEVEHVVLAELRHVGCPHDARYGPGRQVGERVDFGSPRADHRALVHGHVGVVLVLRSEEVVLAALFEHEGIGLVGARVNGETRLRAVRQLRRLEVAVLQAERAVARRSAERAGRLRQQRRDRRHARTRARREHRRSPHRARRCRRRRAPARRGRPPPDGQ